MGVNVYKSRCGNRAMSVYYWTPRIPWHNPHLNNATLPHGDVCPKRRAACPIDHSRIPDDEIECGMTRTIDYGSDTYREESKSPKGTSEASIIFHKASN
jgi:hypothetical protein